MRLLLVGAGRMGGAMLKGWLATSAHEIHVLRPRPKDWLSSLESDGAIVAHDAAKGLAGMSFDAVVLAVKPQMMEEILDDLAPHLGAVDKVISVAAGLKIDFYRPYFPNASHVIRAMPNTPSAVGDGATICVGSQDVSVRKQVHDLLQPWGMWLGSMMKNRCMALLPYRVLGQLIFFCWLMSWPRKRGVLGFPLT